MNIQILTDIFLIISVITLFFQSGFLDSLEQGLSKILFNSRLTVTIPKPFSCEFCLTFWIIMAYLLTTQIPFMIILLSSFLAAFLAAPISSLYSIIFNLINLILTSFDKLLIKLEKLILKI